MTKKRADVLIREEVYRKHLRFIVEPDEHRAERLIRRACKGLPPNADFAVMEACSFLNENADVQVIWMRSMDNVPALAHEIAHLVFYVLGERGVPSAHGSDEAFAYLHTFFMKRAMDAAGMRSLTRMSPALKRNRAARAPLLILARARVSREGAQ